MIELIYASLLRYRLSALWLWACAWVAYYLELTDGGSRFRR